MPACRKCDDTFCDCDDSVDKGTVVGNELFVIELCPEGIKPEQTRKAAATDEERFLRRRLQDHARPRRIHSDVDS